MPQLKIHWKAYPMDRSGVKCCQRGNLTLLLRHRLFSVSEVLEHIRPLIVREYPELSTCAIHLETMQFQEQEAA